MFLIQKTSFKLRLRSILKRKYLKTTSIKEKTNFKHKVFVIEEEIRKMTLFILFYAWIQSHLNFFFYRTCILFIFSTERIVRSTNNLLYSIKLNFVFTLLLHFNLNEKINNSQSLNWLKYFSPIVKSSNSDIRPT